MGKLFRYALINTTRILVVLIVFPARAQVKTVSDSFNIERVLNEVVVSATRTPKPVNEIGVPVKIITKKDILANGSQQLTDILQQQGGLVMANNPLGQSLQGYPNPFGSGIQMQGLDPAYTLILLDGEPLTGRNAGILNLGRLAVGNIQQVEIVKGPATSLYGSDALAGVVNIVTDRPDGNASRIQLNHSSNNTWGLSLKQDLVSKNNSLSMFINTFSTGGYDLDNSIFGKTADPYKNISIVLKNDHRFSEKTQLQQSVRFFTQKQNNEYLIYPDPSKSDTVNGNTVETDWSVNNQLQLRHSEKFRSLIRFYATGYQNNARVYEGHAKVLYDRTFLNQYLFKPEYQVEFSPGKHMRVISGIGYSYEIISSSRYASQKNIQAAYGYLQNEWKVAKQLNITLGARLDKNELYRAQFNPKLALSYQLNRHVRLIASVGTGFKAPDFRQQFLNFTNAVIGYTIIGSNEMNTELPRMYSLGLLTPGSDITAYANMPGLLPEKSTGINAGVKWHLNESLNAEVNVFRNDIKNLIEYYQLDGIMKTNGSGIYSYRNVNKVFTQGIDAGIKYRITKQFSLCASYQYLEAKDKTVLSDIRNRKLVQRDPNTLQSRYITTRDYGGLFNRSKHSAFLQLNYHHKALGLDVNSSLSYKSRFGFIGKTYIAPNGTEKIFENGSSILDDNRKYAPGYFLWNAAINKNISRVLDVQAGVNNILDYKNRETLPNIPGRTIFFNVILNLNHKTNKK